MSETKFINPIDSMSGRLSKKERQGVIFRRKIYRDSQGHIIKKGRNEHFIQVNPRNYEKTPLTPGEQKTVSAFKQALEQYKLDKQNPERMAYWQQRWKAQMRKGDPQAPIDPETGKKRIYGRLDTFIRSMIQISLNT